MTVTEYNESCGSRSCEVPSYPLSRSGGGGGVNSRHQRQKVQVYTEILRRLKGYDLEEARRPGFNDELWSHFNRLPARSGMMETIDAETSLADSFPC